MSDPSCATNYGPGCVSRRLCEPNHDYLGRRDASCGCCCVIDIAGLEHLIDDLETARTQVERVRALADEWECSPGETSFHRRACPGCSRADRLRALLAPTTSENGPGYQPCNHECNGCPTCDPGLATRASADRTARRPQPEGIERVEWGVRFSNGNVFETRTEKSAVDLASDDATYAAVHRTVIEYAPVVTPWEVVGDE